MEDGEVVMKSVHREKSVLTSAKKHSQNIRKPLAEPLQNDLTFPSEKR
jgi:hypothetical protein